jgi:glycosyltransferase involved in cell wall biosynthesis
MREVLVVIPAFNEEASLGRVVAAVRAALPQADIAVVNDASHDGTALIAENLGVIALDLPYHLGLGAAEQTGFRYAMRFGYDRVVRNDGDGQHNPSEIPDLLKALDDTGADVVIGSRYLEDRGYVTPRLRRWGIRLLAGVIGLICRQPFSDPTSGFRAFGRRAVRACVAAYPADYPEPESLVQFVRAGLRVREIPVTMNPRYGGRSSIRLPDSVTYMLRVLLALLADLLRPVPTIPPEGTEG